MSKDPSICLVVRHGFLGISQCNCKVYRCDFELVIDALFTKEKENSRTYFLNITFG